MPRSAACSRPRSIGVPAMIAGRTKMGSARRPPMPRIEMAVSPPTAVAGSLPEAASMRNCVAAPAAWPPGTTKRDGVARQLRGGHREPGLGAQGEALQGDGAGEVGHLGHQGHEEPEQVQRLELRPGAEDGGQGGEDQVDGDAGDHGRHRRLERRSARRAGTRRPARCGWPGAARSRRRRPRPSGAAGSPGRATPCQLLDLSFLVAAGPGVGMDPHGPGIPADPAG